MVTRISSKGQLVLPAEFRRHGRIRAGEQIDVERLAPGEYRLVRRSRPRTEGLVELLLASPVKGWFEPMARTETTDSVHIPELE